MTGEPVGRRATARVRRLARPAKHAARRSALELAVLRSAGAAPTSRIFHDFAPPPAGRRQPDAARASSASCERRGLRVEHGTISRTTRACLFNSFNFDFDRLERFAARADGCTMVHRVGAVTSLYRGFDDGTDRARRRR